MAASDSQLRIQAQGEMLANRVKKRFHLLRKTFARQNIEVFRLYDWDIPEIRAVVDWYAGHLVIGEYMRQQSLPGWLPVMARSVASAMAVAEENVHLKKRQAGKQDGRRYERIDHTDRKIAVSERDFRFLVNPWDYVDTGLFSDHRDTRQMVREMAAGKDFLNLYCYTGTFSCYAARGGARSTLSVDRSKTAILWARENMALNGIPQENHTLVQAETREFLARLRERKLRFDLAVLDPPSYSTTRSRGAAFDIAKDHRGLIEALTLVMRRGSTIIFSTNHQEFELLLSGLKLAATEEITASTIPEDYRSKRKTIHRCWRITV